MLEKGYLIFKQLERDCFPQLTVGHREVVADTKYDLVYGFVGFF